MIRKEMEKSSGDLEITFKLVDDIQLMGENDPKR